MAKLKIKAFQKKTKQNKNPNKFTRTGQIKKKILHGWYDTEFPLSQQTHQMLLMRGKSH